MRQQYCSFCGKRESEVKHLVLGRSAAICNECIDLCSDVNRGGVTETDSVLLTGIGQLATNDRYRDDLLGLIEDAAVVIIDGVVRWAGPEEELPVKYQQLSGIDCGGRAACPGFVDASTRPIFGGEQSQAFAKSRQSGSTTIERATTARATAATSPARLRDESAARLLRMLQHGTTAADARTGHGLPAATEARLLDLVAELHNVGPTLTPTLRVPYHDDIDVLMTEMLAICGPRSRFIDIDCTVFDPEDVSVMAKESRRLGLGVRLTGADFDPATIEAVDPISVDNPHPAMAPAMRATRSVAVLVPAATYGGAPTEARPFLDAGVIVALASGANPETMYVESQQLAIAMATVENGLSVEASLWAATRGGALALDDELRGWIGRGSVGDLVLLDAPTVAHLCYQAGSNLAWRVIKAGRQISSQ